MQFSRYSRLPSPHIPSQGKSPQKETDQKKPVGLSGLEPPTSRLSGVRSNLLSYKPISHKTWEMSIKTGNHLLSHTVSSAVPSAAMGLTVVFGMGTGVSP